MSAENKSGEVERAQHVHETKENREKKPQHETHFVVAERTQSNPTSKSYVEDCEKGFSSGDASGVGSL